MDGSYNQVGDMDEDQEEHKVDYSEPEQPGGLSRAGTGISNTDESPMDRLSRVGTGFSQPDESPMDRLSRIGTGFSQPDESPIDRLSRIGTGSSQPDESPIDRLSRVGTGFSQPDESPMDRLNRIGTGSSQPDESPMDRLSRVGTGFSQPDESPMDRLSRIGTGFSQPDESPIDRLNRVAGGITDQHVLNAQQISANINKGDGQPRRNLAIIGAANADGSVTVMDVGVPPAGGLSRAGTGMSNADPAALDRLNKLGGQPPDGAERDALNRLDSITAKFQESVALLSQNSGIDRLNALGADDVNAAVNNASMDRLNRAMSDLPPQDLWEKAGFIQSNPLQRSGTASTSFSRGPLQRGGSTNTSFSRGPLVHSAHGRAGHITNFDGEDEEPLLRRGMTRGGSRGGLGQTGAFGWTPSPQQKDFLDLEIESSNYNRQLRSACTVICILQVLAYLVMTQEHGFNGSSTSTVAFTDKNLVRTAPNVYVECRI